MEMKLIFNHLDRTPGLEAVAVAHISQALNGLTPWIQKVQVRLGMDASPRVHGPGSFFCEIDAGARRALGKIRVRKTGADLYAAMEEATETLRDVLTSTKKKYLTIRNHPKGRWRRRSADDATA